MKAELMSSIALAPGAKLLSDSKYFSDYARWREDLNAYETWHMAVQRVMDMHRDKYADRMSPELEEAVKFAQAAYEDKLILGAQRALQFGGPQLRKHEVKMYNCASTYADRVAFFPEALYNLLCGCGVGFSVQRRHADRMPEVIGRVSEVVRRFVIPDSIEGWSEAVRVLFASYTITPGYEQYFSCPILFDYSEIRPKGAMISGGFKAPGPEGLRRSLQNVENLLERELKGKSHTKLRPIDIYDITMHLADAVLSGGVRRAATLCMFDKSDMEMMKAKTGNWFTENPQRGRSNNSAVLIRDELSKEEFMEIMQNVKQFGEPGFIFSDSADFTFNPCVEIGMLPVTEDGESGWQFCNLTEQNGAVITSKEIFLRSCKAAAILGTLQAGYTDFKVLTDATIKITEREALIGVSITGWMNNPHILFDKEILKEGAELVKSTNREIAKLIGINPAARTTCAKPSGNASTLLGSEPGIHGAHSRRYLRNMQKTANEEVAQLIQKTNPEMCEVSVWNTMGTDLMISFPVEVPPNSIFKKDLLGVKFLEYIKIAQSVWVEHGTDESLCRDNRLRHNISNTVSVDNWDEVAEYLYENRKFFAGVSLLSSSGDKDYVQAPYIAVMAPDELVQSYGTASVFASGLVVDGLHAYGNDLWAACAAGLGYGSKIMPSLVMADMATVDALTAEAVDDPLRRDWIRRMHKFAVNFFDGNLTRASYCLKDVHNLHRWEKITRKFSPIDFASVLGPKDYIEVDTLGAQACSGGVCEFTL